MPATTTDPWMDSKGTFWIPTKTRPEESKGNVGELQNRVRSPGTRIEQNLSKDYMVHRAANWAQVCGPVEMRAKTLPCKGNQSVPANKRHGEQNCHYLQLL